MRKNKTVRSIVLDFVQQNGPQPYNPLKQVVLIAAGQPLTRHDYGSSYLDQVSSSSVCYPTRNESRYLQKGENDLYYLMNAR